MSPDDITADWLSDVLGGDVRSVEARPIGDGHVSTTIRLTLVTDDPTIPSSIVAKVPAEDERSRLLAASVRSYEREVKLFRELAATVDIRMPHCHHADWDPATNDYVVLLEDMSPAEQGDQLAGCSVERPTWRFGSWPSCTVLAGTTRPWPTSTGSTATIRTRTPTDTP